MKKISDQLVFSPSDLILYLSSPFASWMDRYHLENRGLVTPDLATEEARLIAKSGDDHERIILGELKASPQAMIEISKSDQAAGCVATLAAITDRVPIIYQAALQNGPFAGFADFLMLDSSNRYQVWDTKLACAPKPYYAIQLCCYSEMLAAVTGDPLPEKFGIILGNKEREEFQIEDFLHYYRRIKDGFIAMQAGFTGKIEDRPEPLPRADHGRWASHAETFLRDADHLVQVAGISTGQIKKLKSAGIATLTDLAAASGRSVPRLAAASMEALVTQARLQTWTRSDRISHEEAPPRYELLPHIGINGESVGLAAIPPDHPMDVFFDMEGYPLIAGGLEYLFGVCIREDEELVFKDWWAHDRNEEKVAFEGFVDWVFNRWKSNPGMHVYHYAPYEVSAVRRLSTRRATREDEVDELFRGGVFVDLYHSVRHGLRIGEDSYSIKKVERLYRPKRATGVTTAVDSIVQYARWMGSGQPRDWTASKILKDIRDYNEDDCKSTAELLQWLRTVAKDNQIHASASTPASPNPERKLPPDAIARGEIAKELSKRTDIISPTLVDLIDFHRREEKPMWWRMFSREKATSEELRDDPGCIEGVRAVGQPLVEKQSLVQEYTFDPAQECKLDASGRAGMKFTHQLNAGLTLVELNTTLGRLRLKISRKALDEKFGGKFPSTGSLLSNEFVSAETIQTALTEVCSRHLSGHLPESVFALLKRLPPVEPMQVQGESPLDAAIRVTQTMTGGCLVIQGPPGTGKTYTASRVIAGLLAEGKKIGLASNSHKAVVNLLSACGEATRALGNQLRGMKVSGDPEESVFKDNPGLIYSKDGDTAYNGGVVGGTAWVFSHARWEGQLDFLFIDEAGQVSLANAVAMARCASNLVLLGDQMQLEQPVQGSHPGDAGLSVLQYALKDTAASRPDAPVFHAVVPPEYGLFLGESRRMHPNLCRFISESIYEGRLNAHPSCALQKIAVPNTGGQLIRQESGVLFSGIEHEGNIQQSAEEVARVKDIFEELRGRLYTGKDGKSKQLELDDFLFIAPYNAQVRALQSVLPKGARVGSVDKFQGQEAPVCIYSLCSSYGEYGSRGLGFILDRNRVNVALSRAKCLAVVVADPRIAQSPANSIAEMTLLNLFCKFQS